MKSKALQVHSLQSDLCLDLADILILEYAALAPRTEDVRIFMSGLLSYSKDWLPGLKLTEVQQRLHMLVGEGLMDAQRRCDPALVTDVAANAKLSGRANSRALKRSRRPVDDPVEALTCTWVGASFAEKMIERIRFADSFRALAPEFQELAYRRMLPARLDALEPGGAILESMERTFEDLPAYERSTNTICRFAARGAQGLRKQWSELPVGLMVLQGRDEEAIGFLKGLDMSGSSTITRLFFILAMIRQGKSIEWYRLNGTSPGLRQWGIWLEQVRRSVPVPRPSSWQDLRGRLGLLLVGGAALWEEDFDLFGLVQPDLRQARDKAAASGWGYVAELFDQLAEDRPGPLRDFLPRQPGWRRQLDRLLSLGEVSENAAERVIWRLRSEDGEWLAEPFAQKRNKKGWTPGRNLLVSGSVYQFSRQDAEAIGEFRGLNPEAGWRCLVGHPLLFFKEQPVELTLGEPQLRVLRHGGRIRLQLQPQGLANGYDLRLLAPGRLELVLLPSRLADLAEVLGPGGFSVPEDCEEQLVPVLSKVSGLLSIASDVEVDDHTIEERELHRTVYLRLTPGGAGLRMQALVRPFGAGTNAYLANEGPARLVVQEHGRTVQVVRDLPHEREVLAELGLEGAGPWMLPDPLSCLEFLEQLAACERPDVEAEWPEGQPFRLKKPSGSWGLRTESKTDWFEVSGGLELEPGQELKVVSIMEMMRQAQGRFVPLSDGEFLALSEEMAERLRRMSQIAEPSKGSALRFHPLAAGLLLDVPELQADREFQKRIAEIRKFSELQAPLPKAFKGELRAYQSEGYRWLAQRAEWGVGACLADDMGLGKTIQALALLLLRAARGPALVVAPTSVTYNWLQEALRFAPTLKVWDLREHPRSKLLGKVRAGDLVVCSYGLMVNEIERLEQVEWATVLLDEAQAIKNPASQRNLAACRLRASARIATTGTPLENRLDELWALFRFLNPGLLGGQQRFRQRFVLPIENADAQARTTLRRLVHPFLLRRTKNQVLTELPPRTEVTLEVPMSDEERAFYEALRRRAVDQLQGEKTDAMHVLAELTRLRRACCHPSLVDKKTRGPGSKQQTLLSLLAELKQGGHQALVFSQFVEHLSLIRPLLEVAGFTYQYLDGSTPAKSRKQQVELFQAGESDLFLISLKAGGVGLNLTAADYVIHLDPWWNPAVEDQASDRAHRIGQKRPVTVYRLVAQNTVEDKIVALHASKRELAQSLLEGTESPARLDAEAMLALIREDSR